MSFRISGRNIDIGEALRTRINERIAEATAKYFDGGALPEQRAIEAPSYVIAAPEHDDDGVAEFNPVIIAESTTALKRLSVSEAVMELDLTGGAVVVFRHAGHGRVNLVYRRGDGHIGWIDPPRLDGKDAAEAATKDAAKDSH
jgi:hypothetical protein